MLQILQRYQSQLAKIQLVLFDVDGVMTDGSITYTSEGIELKTFNAKDGQGLAMLAQEGFATGILTARHSPILDQRAKDIGLTHLYQGVKNKYDCLISLASTLDLPLDAIAYMGDDLPDLMVLKTVGFSACPADAVDAVQAACHWISTYAGGKGAVREFCDLLIAAKC